MTDHLDLHNGASLTSVTTNCPPQNDVAQKKLQPAELAADFCWITGACPCVAPCGWALLAQDAVKQYGWPDLGQCRKDRPLVDIPE
jgi:hypothetical protein